MVAGMVSVETAMDVVTMDETETATVICGERAASCVCALTPGHDGPHQCGNDTGSWSGTFDSDDFKVICYPFPLIPEDDDGRD